MPERARPLAGALAKLWSDCDTVFITANFVQDKKTDSKDNQDKALLRFEWFEAIIRTAIAKYGRVWRRCGVG